MRKKLLICNMDPGIGMMVRNFFSSADYTIVNCTMYPYDIRTNLNKRKYDTVVFFAGENKYDVAFFVRKLRETSPETDIIVVMLYKWDNFEKHYYDEGADLCVWLQDTPASLLANFIKLLMFRRSYTDVDPDVSLFLAYQGFTGFYKGFYYLCTAVSICLKEPERLKRVIERVYTETAERCGAPNYKSVEREMRYYIKCIFSSDNLDPMLKKIFPERPTLKRCISGLCNFYNKY